MYEATSVLYCYRFSKAELDMPCSIVGRYGVENEGDGVC